MINIVNNDDIDLKSFISCYVPMEKYTNENIKSETKKPIETLLVQYGKNEVKYTLAEMQNQTITKIIKQETIEMKKYSDKELLEWYFGLPKFK